MRSDRQIQHVVDRWLADGSDRAPDRVLDMVAYRIERVDQRPAWRLHWRSAPMNTGTGIAALAVPVAAAIVILVAGSWLMANRPGVGGPLDTHRPPSAAAISPTDVSPSPDHSASAIPSPSPFAGTWRDAALVVPLSFWLGPGWSTIDDGPNLLSLRYDPWPPDGDQDIPTISIGVPYGYASAADLLAAMRAMRFPPSDPSSLVSDWCPQMAAPVPMTIDGFAGMGFFCDGNASIDLRPLYPVTVQGAVAGVPASLAEAGGWFVLPKSVDGTSVVMEVDGVPVVLTVSTGHQRGPRQNGKPLDDATVDLIASLRFTFH